MHTGFDGDYRRRPTQNLGGASHVSDRETIIRKAQDERRKRSELRKQIHGATVLQSFVRSFIHRTRIKKIERENFDEYLIIHKSNLSKSSSFDQKNLLYLLKRLLFFYTIREAGDSDRLITICQYIIKNTKKVSELLNGGLEWNYRIKKLLVLCLEQLAETNYSHAIPMRTVEIFTYKNSPNSDRLLAGLISENYFEKVRKILENKCPPLDGPTLRAPDATTQAVYDMIIRALTLARSETNPVVWKEICISFASHFLSKKPSEPITCFVLPSFKEKENFENFPFEQLVVSLGEICMDSSKDLLDTMELDDINTSIHQKQKDVLMTSYLFKHLLQLDTNYDVNFTKYSLCSQYLAILSELSSHLLKLPKRSVKNLLAKYGDIKYDDLDNDDNDSDSDSEEYDSRLNPSQKSYDISEDEIQCLLEVIDLLQQQNRIHWILHTQIENFCMVPNQLYQISVLCHNFLLMSSGNSINNLGLFHISNLSKFLRNLWFTLVKQSNKLGFNSPLSLISKGVIPKADTDIERTIPFLATFCALYGKDIPTMHDDEFLKSSEEEPLPFSVDEIIQLSKTLKEISLGLVELAYPETRTNLNNHYRNVLGRTDADDEKIKQKQQIWAHLLKVVVCVLNQLYNRDLRMNFCPEGHWIVDNLNLSLDKDWDVPLINIRRGMRPFEPIKDFTKKDLGKGPPPSTKQIRSMAILREIPFVVPFTRRVNILQGLIASDKIKIQGGLQAFLQGPIINLSVRRSHLYEDSFDKLRPENEPDLRHMMKIQFVSSLGLDEIGIDGGGVFREYLNELLKTAFDPNRGFFMLTTDNKLYPNPNVAEIIDDFDKHYEFIGRILGKAIYENLRVELPLAECFLTKLAGRKYSTHDMHQLASLDPELYKHLLSLNGHQDIDGLGLDFTVVTSTFGQTQVKVNELKPGGQNIAVSAFNIDEYIGLVADFKLSKQIHLQCKAFRRGLSNLLPVEWLYMFSNKELQILISGAEIPIDLDDLRNNCRYGPDYSPEHPSIQSFWRVVEEFNDLQRRQLLKFVTSSTRPPLNGFKDLDPPFCIQNTNDEDRLPTASTCTNLLKLPPFKSDEIMKEKLLYAIQSGAGFELS